MHIRNGGVDRNGAVLLLQGIDVDETSRDRLRSS